MIVESRESTIWIDVDDTLVIWGKSPEEYPNGLWIPNPHYLDESPKYLVPHEGHIRILKDRKARGSAIIVWSAGGNLWAETIIKALGLEAYVDYIFTKPHAYIDDKTADEFMKERIYLPLDNPYGK